MRKVTVYKFDDLSPELQQKVLNQHYGPGPNIMWTEKEKREKASKFEYIKLTNDRHAVLMGNCLGLVWITPAKE